MRFEKAMTSLIGENVLNSGIVLPAIASTSLIFYIMPRQQRRSSGGSRPSSSSSSRSSGSIPQNRAPATFAAQPSTPTQSYQQQPQSRGPGMLASMAANAGSVAAGSAVVSYYC